ncbi:MAG: tRNA-dihydrouridine synthase [Candidatus Magasanikbacteria bacterium GW2011_GWA2_37_8]|uniref:tRNA-dihydrouridine synthase n=1 Tax=Candidatus Magasanikbacteria bacterium GW2011_GWA2_37_8 TaxID=1619036 RepID=A0A0G0HDT1_9BACT|nr:MAG: tRNA-dihydrouridine synthase [Candidatus Magasanikbacteria bacterium GW2011_GWA2_37_8]
MSWINSKQSIIALAPLADYTDGPFCRLCREQGVRNKDKGVNSDFVVFREMVSAEAIVRGSEKTLKMCEFDEIERPIVIQIFGGKTDIIVEAAKIVVSKYKPDGIDINMGCPVPKIAGKGHGGADLMRKPELAAEIVKALKMADLGVPISVKTRLGWLDDKEILDFAPRLEQAGVDAITLHGRTKIQGYAGKANWGRIGEVKKLLKIPLIANGDIVTLEDFKKCLEVTRADGVMIGRGALGRPWVFGQFGANSSQPIGCKEIKQIMLRHAELHLGYYGEKGIISLRKYLPWYLKGMENMKTVRTELVRANSLEELKQILQKIPS